MADILKDNHAFNESKLTLQLDAFDTWFGEMTPQLPAVTKAVNTVDDRSADDNSDDDTGSTSSSTNSGAEASRTSTRQQVARVHSGALERMMSAKSLATTTSKGPSSADKQERAARKDNEKAKDSHAGMFPPERNKNPAGGLLDRGFLPQDNESDSSDYGDGFESDGSLSDDEKPHPSPKRLESYKQRSFKTDEERRPQSSRDEETKQNQSEEARSRGNVSSSSRGELCSKGRRRTGGDPLSSGQQAPRRRVGSFTRRNQLSHSEHGLQQVYSATSSVDISPPIRSTTNNKRDELLASWPGPGRRRSTKRDELSTRSEHGPRRSTKKEEVQRRRPATKGDAELSVSRGRVDAAAESTSRRSCLVRRRRDDLSRSEHAGTPTTNIRHHQRPSCGKAPSARPPQSMLSQKHDGTSSRRSRDELAGDQHTSRFSQESTSGIIKRVSSSVTFLEGTAEIAGGTRKKRVGSGPSISSGSMLPPRRSPCDGLNTSRHRAPNNLTTSSVGSPINQEYMMRRSGSSGDHAGAMRRVRSSGATMEEDKPQQHVIDNLLRKQSRRQDSSRMSSLKANSTWDMNALKDSLEEDPEDDPWLTEASELKRVQSGVAIPRVWSAREIWRAESP